MDIHKDIDTITDQSSAENKSRASERAIIAAAKQIIDEKIAKEVIRPHEPRTKCTEGEKRCFDSYEKRIGGYEEPTQPIKG